MQIKKLCCVHFGACNCVMDLYVAGKGAQRLVKGIDFKLVEILEHPIQPAAVQKQILTRCLRQMLQKHNEVNGQLTRQVTQKACCQGFILSEVCLCLLELFHHDFQPARCRAGPTRRLVQTCFGRIEGTFCTSTVWH